MIAAEEQVFAALGDTTRRQILNTLARSSPKTATQLSHEFPMTRQGIVKHLDLLASAGLVQARVQGREKHYSFAPEPLNNVSAWIETIGKEWEGRLGRLKALVESDEEI